MVFGWNKSRFSPIAVDFGADSLKLLQVIAADPPQIVAAAAFELPEQTRGDPAARQACLVEALKTLLKGGGFKGRRAICSIPAFQMLVQHLQIPRAEGEDMDTQIGLQLRQRLNIDPARMVLRSLPVAQITRDGSPRTEVICLAASRDTVLRHIDLAHRARLEVVGMHAEPLAVLKAFEHLYRRHDDAQRTTCFIDIGAATTKVTIAHGPALAAAKIIHAAGDHFTRACAKARGISFGEARQARMLGGTRGDETPGAAVAVVEPPRPAPRGLAVIEAPISAERGGGAAEEVHPEAEAGDTLDCLIDELRLCVRYHQSIFPERTIEKLVFLGGESRHIGTCQKIAQALRIGAQLGDPLARLARITQTGAAMGVDLRQPQPGWAVPLGLCTSEANL